jgi:hypothetical protein
LPAVVPTSSSTPYPPTLSPTPSPTDSPTPPIHRRRLRRRCQQVCQTCLRERSENEYSNDNAGTTNARTWFFADVCTNNSWIVADVFVPWIFADVLVPWTFADVFQSLGFRLRMSTYAPTQRCSAASLCCRPEWNFDVQVFTPYSFQY